MRKVLYHNKLKLWKNIKEKMVEFYDSKKIGKKVKKDKLLLIKKFFQTFISSCGSCRKDAVAQQRKWGQNTYFKNT